VIANAPNPAGFAILKESFEGGSISVLGLAAAATVPTVVAAAAFQFFTGVRLPHEVRAMATIKAQDGSNRR
jgi:hypothetical protein